MGLLAELQTEIKDAFDNDLEDAVVSVTLRHKDKTATVYDPVTGLSTDSTTDYETRGVFYEYSTLERFNTHIEPNDVKFIILANEVSIVPAVRDSIINGTKVYRVIGFVQDPVIATYELQLRTT